MTNTMIAHKTATITPEMITGASMLIRLARPDDASLGRAVERARERLIALPWVVVEGILQIASHSHPNDVHVTDGADCTCEASRGVCWHVGAYTILSAIAAVGINPVAAIPLPTVLDEDELPASFLDGDLSAFDDVELTMPFEDLAPVAPFRVQPARVMAVDARSEALADELFA